MIPPMKYIDPLSQTLEIYQVTGLPILAPKTCKDGHELVETNN